MNRKTTNLAPSAFAFACSVAVALIVLAWPRVASAQEWLKDRRYQEGAGIRVGDVELHPGIGGEVGYDSNWFLRTDQSNPAFVNGPPNNPVRDGAVLRLTPSFSIASLGSRRTTTDGVSSTPPSLTFRGTVAATYREFLGAEELRRQRNVSGNAALRMDILPQRPIGFGVFAGYQRFIQPSVVADPNLSFNRSDINAGAEVIALPGGGNLDLRLGYQFFASLFEQSNGVPYTSFTHDITARNRWKFRPRTALFHDTSLKIITYPNADRSLFYLNESTPLRTRMGLTGLVTDRIGTLVALGYSGSFFRDPAAASTRQYDSLNAQAQGTFYLSTPAGGAPEPGQATLLLSTITVGFSRDFQNSLLGNYYTSNKGYAQLVYFFGGRTLIQLDGYGEALSFPPVFYNTAAGAPPTQVQTDFTNFRVGGTLFGEYRFSDSFGINATLSYVQLISDTAIPASAGAGNTQLFNLAYRRLQAFLGARWFL